MRLLMVSVVFASKAFSKAEDSSARSTDNIFKKFLEVAVKDEHSRLAVSKDKKHDVPHIQDIEHPNQRKKTVIVVEEDSDKKSVILNPKVGQKITGIDGEANKKKRLPPKHKDPRATEDTPKPEIQSELTFETPISASFLLKPLEPKKEVSFTQVEIKEVKEELKALERISKDLESLKGRFQSTFRRILSPEKEEKGPKPPTDLLNYNFIEVTETGQQEKK
ncbi:hypothetical protein M970_020940 [Encephalitozoon cuniculi EcunIII-L]|uniref:Uncharacterized protein n=1 Tax=Encephalitozoon cuniculi TaxID=6035 RepID=M1K8I3_ENCCN|nr:hypothetical protein ECU02_0990 [Encephalitozoon cuniculi]KMV66617.1 hypothetical protein M970_020940 [Encephalitozoon cuniculi EcunIII-L]UYI28292.1 hypothetical protein J0A71_10g21970 [Encephalitozoon cuniculi]